MSVCQNAVSFDTEDLRMIRRYKKSSLLFVYGWEVLQHIWHACVISAAGEIASFHSALFDYLFVYLLDVYSTVSARAENKITG